MTLLSYQNSYFRPSPYIIIVHVYIMYQINPSRTESQRSIFPQKTFFKSNYILFHKLSQIDEQTNIVWFIEICKSDIALSVPMHLNFIPGEERIFYNTVHGRYNIIEKSCEDRYLKKKIFWELNKILQHFGVSIESKYSDQG